MRGLRLGLGFSRGGAGSGGSAGGFPTDPSLWMAFQAGDPANGAGVSTFDFTSAAVDTANNTVDLGITDFGPHGTYASQGGTEVFFSTTGTLPGGLLADTPYYASRLSGTVYRIYPRATDADAASLPGFTAEHNIGPGQKFAQRVGELDLTSGGTGMHTMYTREISRYMIDPVNGYRAGGASDRNWWFEIDADIAGDKYVRSGRIAKDHNGTGSYDFYGKLFQLLPNVGGTNLDVKNNIGNKRVVYESFVLELEPFETRGTIKIPTDSTRVNTSTDLITRNAFTLNTGDLVRLKLDSGSTAPAPLAEGVDYWLRKVSANTFSLHPSQADASANTNIIDLTTTGSGTFVFYSPQYPADINRGSYIVELIEPNGGQNTLSPPVWYTPPSGAGRISPTATYIPLTGGDAGNLYNQKAFVDWAGPVVKVAAYIPATANGPTCTDTGLPLTSGTYWLTQSPGSSTYARLHRTEADALAAVGVVNTSLSNAQMIKFSDTGTAGWQLNFHPDVGTGFSFNYWRTGPADAPFYVFLPFGRKMLVTFLVDFNDPDPAITTAQLYLYIDGVQVLRHSTNSPKGNTPAATTGSPGTLMNSAASHVPFIGKWYAGFFGSDAGAFPTAGVQQCHDYLKAEYGL